MLNIATKLYDVHNGFTLKPGMVLFDFNGKEAIIVESINTDYFAVKIFVKGKYVNYTEWHSEWYDIDDETPECLSKAAYAFEQYKCESELLALFTEGQYSDDKIYKGPSFQCGDWWYEKTSYAGVYLCHDESGSSIPDTTPELITHTYKKELFKLQKEIDEMGY
ncbi:MAG: hypothetical protein WCR54_08920 [Clostridia bacterium]